MKIAEFFVGLAFDGDKSKVDDFDNSLQGLQQTISTLKVAALAAGIERIADAAADATSRLRSVEAQTSVSIKEIQKLQSAANAQNISLSFDQVASSIKGVEQNLAQIRLGGGNVRPFQLLGIDASQQNPITLIDDVRQAIKGLDDATATNIIQEMGFEPEFIRILRRSKEEMEDMVQEGALSETGIKRVESLGRQMAKFRQQVKFIGEQFTATFQPVIETIFQLFTGVVFSIREFLGLLRQLNLETVAFAAAAATMAKAVGVLSLAFSPITIAITGLLLLLEDIAVFMRGGDSLFGRFIEGMQEVAASIKEAFDNILPDFSGIKEILALGGEMNKDAPKDRLQGAGGMGDIGTGLLSGLGSDGLLGSITNTFNNVFNINSSAEGRQLSKDVVSEQQRQLNHSLADFNNGAAN